MTIEYALDEKDYLTHQLFAASQSKRIKRQRLRNRLLGLILFAAIGFSHFMKADRVGTVCFSTGALLWFFFYPLWERWYYKKHYQSSVNELYKQRFGKISVVALGNDYIFTREHGIESKLSFNEVEEISEIPAMVFLKLRDGHYLLLPKGKISNIDLVKSRLKELAATLKIEYKVHERWEWK